MGRQASWQYNACSRRFNDAIKRVYASPHYPDIKPDFYAGKFPFENIWLYFTYTNSSEDRPVVEADMKAVTDRGEAAVFMEPIKVGESSPHRGALAELVVEIAAKSTGFRRSMPEGVVVALADLVRAMNCYHSNLIEGHNTHPVDIERAMRNEYSDEPRKRNLQLEARAHVTVQKWIDQGGLAGRAATQGGVCDIHKRFGEMLPDELLWLENPESGEHVRLEPGTLRNRDVKVGDHVPISPGAETWMAGVAAVKKRSRNSHVSFCKSVSTR